MCCFVSLIFFSTLFDSAIAFAAFVASICLLFIQAIIHEQTDMLYLFKPLQSLQFFLNCFRKVVGSVKYCDENETLDTEELDSTAGDRC